MKKIWNYTAFDYTHAMKRIVVTYIISILFLFLFSSDLCAENKKIFQYPKPIQEDDHLVDDNALFFLSPGDRSAWDALLLANQSIDTSIRSALFSQSAITNKKYYTFINSFVFHEKKGNALKPLHDLRYSLFLSNSSMPLWGESENISKSGSISRLYHSGAAYFKNMFGGYYQLRHEISDNKPQSELYRGFVYAHFNNLLLFTGKDTLHLGPGEYGLLMSGTGDPYFMVKMQNAHPLNFYGSWNIVLMNGWLDDTRDDVNDPRIFAIRVTYQFSDWLRIGLTRTSMYGGEGRYTYKLKDIPELIIGSKENIPNGKYDNDAFGGYDITFNIPLKKWFPSIDLFSIYFQEAGTDISAIWQEEDFGDIVAPFLFFRFYERAYQIGILTTIENHIFRLEYVKTALSFFRHHNYPAQGFTFRGACLGFPLGTNIQTIYFKHRFFLKKSSINYLLGMYQLPAHSESDHKKKIFALNPLFSTGSHIVRRWYFDVTYEYFIRNVVLKAHAKLDAGYSNDSNKSPVKFKKDDTGTIDYILGFSMIWKF